MEISIVEYSKEQGKSYTTVYNITYLELDLDYDELSIVIENKNNPSDTRSFRYALKRPLSP